MSVREFMSIGIVKGSHPLSNVLVSAFLVFVSSIFRNTEGLHHNRFFKFSIIIIIFFGVDNKFGFFGNNAVIFNFFKYTAFFEILSIYTPSHKYVTLLFLFTSRRNTSTVIMNNNRVLLFMNFAVNPHRDVVHVPKVASLYIVSPYIKPLHKP